MMIRDARVDDGVLSRGGRIELAPERVEDLRDLLRRIRLGSLEQQVLDEVRDPGLPVRLVARAGADPEAERDRADVVEPFGDQALAAVELRQDVLLHVRSLGAGGRARTSCHRAAVLNRRFRPPRSTYSRARPARSTAATLYQAVNPARPIPATTPARRPASVRLTARAIAASTLTPTVLGRTPEAAASASEAM